MTEKLTKEELEKKRKIRKLISLYEDAYPHIVWHGGTLIKACNKEYKKKYEIYINKIIKEGL